MKKYVMAILMVASTIAAKAQSYKYNQDVYPVTYGIMAGGITALQVSSPDAVNGGKKIKFAGTFGLNVDFRLSDNVSVRPGIMYAGKGGTASGSYTDANGNGAVTTNDYSLNYLEVPVDLLIHAPLDDDASIYFGAGPFIGYGLKATNNQTSGGDTEKQAVVFGGGGDFNKADYGISTSLGFQASNWFSISANADIGLKNILLVNNAGYNVTGIKTLLFYLTLGKSF